MPEEEAEGHTPEAASPGSEPGAHEAARDSSSAGGEGLVFGELLEEDSSEAYQTPLTASRTPSAQLCESPQPPASAPEEQRPEQQAQEQQEAYASSSASSDGEPAAAEPAAAPPTACSGGEEPADDAAAVAPAPAAAAQQSGLLSLQQLSLQQLDSSHVMRSGSPSAASCEASRSSDTGAEDGAGSAAEVEAVSAAAEAAAAGASPWEQQQQQAPAPDPGAQPDGVCPPVRCGSSASAGGSVASLERAPSWQLQHAAAAAAGTAAHPAPPRSDMDLARLSNTPASPHGEAGWAAWQRRRRHFFVLTAAGKPVFSRHGDEQALAGFMAVMQALLSVVADQGDAIRAMTVGGTSLSFLVRGQLYFVAASSRGEAPAALRRQLELMHQAVTMVVTGGIERLLTRSPGYDLQQLLAGAKPSLNALLSGFGDCPGWIMSSAEPAPASAQDRQAVSAALADAVKSCDCLYGLLLAGDGRLVALERGPGTPQLHVLDLLLLSNFATSNASLRHSETFVPVCLPHLQPNAFLHAYVMALDDVAPPLQQQQPLQPQQPQQAQQEPQHEPQQQPPQQQEPQQQEQQQLEQQPDLQQQQQPLPGLQQQQGAGDAGSSSMFLLLLSGSADSFHKLAAAQRRFMAALAADGAGGGVLARVQAAAVRPGGGRLGVEALPAPLGGAFGSTPLWHAIIRFPQRRQHITLRYPPQLFAARSQVKQLVRAYCRLHCAAYAPVLESAAAAAAAAAAAPAGSSAGASGVAAIVGAAPAAAASAASAAAAAAAAYVGAHGTRPHKLVWVTSLRWVTAALVDRDVELYVTFDPLTEKEVGLKLADMLRRLFAGPARRAELLVPTL